jgi:hypothetical protein
MGTDSCYRRGKSDATARRSPVHSWVWSSQPVRLNQQRLLSALSQSRCAR